VAASVRDNDSAQTPSRAAFLLAAASYAGITGLNLLASRTRLPYDGLFSAVEYLMNSATAGLMAFLIHPLGIADRAIRLVGFLVCLAGAVVPLYRVPRFAGAVGRVCYRYAIALPLYLLLASQMSRYVANLIYFLTRNVTWNLTPFIARIEGGILTSFQSHLSSPFLSQICAIIYSVVWLVPLAALGPVLVGLVFLDEEPKVVNHLVAGEFLLAVLAVPFFALLPVFDPWTTNPIYGNPGPLPLKLLYLYPHADVEALTRINVDLHWATGCCFPSLHVSYPLMVYWILRRNNFPRLSWVFLASCLLNSFAILHLGRHWIADILAAIPYTYMVVRVVERMDLNLVLPLAFESAARVELREP
jgi:PAP2 superfamily